jgi:hypothetical protein
MAGCRAILYCRRMPVLLLQFSEYYNENRSFGGYRGIINGSNITAPYPGSVTTLPEN